MAGEYTGGVLREGLSKFIAAWRADLLTATNGAVVPLAPRLDQALKTIGTNVQPRPPVLRPLPAQHQPLRPLYEVRQSPTIRRRTGR